MGTFQERIAELRRQVGAGRLTGHIEVNQVYAAWQHFHPEFVHPDGGKAYYLRDPFFAEHTAFMQHLAEKLITENGSEIESAMADNMERASNLVYENAPWEFGDLRASGHPSVERNGELVHDRAPHIHRLSKEELRIKGELSRLLDPERYGYEPSRIRRSV